MKNAFRLLAVSALSAHFVSAQNQIDQVDTTDRNLPKRSETPLSQRREVPTLYEGELEDLGPQYLLIQNPPRDWFEFFADLQIYSSDNATLSENNAEGSDLLAFTAQAAWLPYAGKQFGGKIQTRLGYREQYFFYGTFSGQEATVNGTPAEDLDFTNRQPFADLTYTCGALSVNLGIRYSELRNRKSDSRFYTEVVPTWSLAYEIELSQKSLLTLAYGGEYRFTDSESFGLLPDNWNDQTKHGLSATYSRLLSDNLIVQASGGLDYAHFTHKDRSRNDLLGFTNLTLAYFFTDHLSARLFTSYEARESSEALTDDYSNWNLGGGGSLNWSF